MKQHQKRKDSRNDNSCLYHACKENKENVTKLNKVKPVGEMKNLARILDEMKISEFMITLCVLVRFYISRASLDNNYVMKDSPCFRVNKGFNTSTTKLTKEDIVNITQAAVTVIFVELDRDPSYHVQKRQKRHENLKDH